MVSWQGAWAGTNISSLQLNNPLFTVEYDTNPSFGSLCSLPICSTLNKFPSGTVLIDRVLNISNSSSVFSYLIQDLTPGQTYYVRVRACYNTTTKLTYQPDRLCSGYAYLGFPGDSQSVIPAAVPGPILGGSVTVMNDTSASVEWLPPFSLPQGINGRPLDSIAVSLSTSTGRVQTITITDPSSQFPNDSGITFSSGLSAVSRCVPLSTSAGNLELKLQELAGLGDGRLSVTMDTATSTATSRVFSLSFSATLGDDVTTHVAFAGACHNQSLPIGVTVTTATVVPGVRPAVPPVVSFATLAIDPSIPLSGAFELRYAFLAPFTKLAPTSDLTSSITGSVAPGQTTMITSDSVRHLLAPGVEVRIGDQEVTVTDVALDGFSVRFTPYHVRGVEDADLYVRETLLGAAVPFAAFDYRFTIDIASELFVGDSFLVTRGNANDNTGRIVDRLVFTATSVQSGRIRADDTPDLLPLQGTARMVAVYRQQNRVVPYDIAPDELQHALAGLTAVGSASASRVGPNAGK